MLAWEPAVFVGADDGGLAIEVDGVSCTLLSHGDAYLLAWSIKMGGATLPDVEAVVTRVARAIREVLDRDFDVTWTPEDG